MDPESPIEFVWQLVPMDRPEVSRTPYSRNAISIEGRQVPRKIEGKQDDLVKNPLKFYPDYLSRKLSGLSGPFNLL